MTVFHGGGAKFQTKTTGASRHTGAQGHMAWTAPQLRNKNNIVIKDTNGVYTRRKEKHIYLDKAGRPCLLSF